MIFHDDFIVWVSLLCWSQNCIFMVAVHRMTTKQCISFGKYTKNKDPFKRQISTSNIIEGGKREIKGGSTLLASTTDAHICTDCFLCITNKNTRRKIKSHLKKIHPRHNEDVQ